MPSNPYPIALGFRLETLYEFLLEKNQDDSLTHVIFESRGKKEDDEQEFRRDQVGVGFENWGLKIFPAPEGGKPR